MRLSAFILIILALVTLAVYAGTNSLTSVSGGKVQTTHVNQYYSAFNQDLVPRNSSGVPTTSGGSLGSSTYKWLNLFLANNLSMGGNLTMGTSVVSFPNTKTMTISDGSTALPAVVSPMPGTNGLRIVRGCVHWNGSAMVIDSGEGFTVARSIAGVYNVSFTTSFTDVPAFTVSVDPSTGAKIGAYQSLTSSSVQAQSYSTAGALVEASQAYELCFIAVGQRS